MRWIRDLFKRGRGCNCQGCKITAMGWGYAPCSTTNKKRSTNTRQPPKIP
ncbi:hypothetical protein [Acinetobacter venetianus]|nr:hypothetical protein [Acinetobacter venetianus]